MFGGGHRARRFSLLLLEEGEDYVGDWVATAVWPPSVPGNAAGAPTLPGRLRLASKSLFFEPDDPRCPIARLPLAATTRLEAVPGTDSTAFEVVATAVTRMKADNADGPYGFDRFEGDRSGGGGGPRDAPSAPLLPPPTWRFTLPYASLEAVLPSAHTYLAASRLPYGDRAAALADLAARRVSAATFDPSRLADYGEALAWEGPARLAGPLTSQAGRLAITDARLYFQPLDDLDGDVPVRSHELARVGALARRRAGLRPVGLEVFFLLDGAGAGASLVPDRAGAWGGPSALFTFPSPAARDAAAGALARGLAAKGSAGPASASAPSSSASTSAMFEDPSRIAAVTAAWSAGRLSNLDYLLFLNLAAGRSFADVSQYPVVPWVLSDWTSPVLDLSNPASFRDLSKPMGALSPTRLATFKERMAHMGGSGPGGGGPGHPDARDAPFLYGTHFSCPGYVLFWLVRAAPAHMLRLQGGRFDAPDRLFASVGEAWASAAGSPADVKELIPEFYLSDPSFLVNGSGLALGRRQDGRPVDDVALPPWSGGDPSAFLAAHRAALESPRASANLHHWVDLVFGFKARGPAALAADNLFHPLTYEDALPADLEAAFPDPRDRAALEVQVSEFGQCPRQLFTEPHPRRTVCPAWEKEGGSGGESASGATATTSPAALALAVLATVSAAVEGGSGGSDGGAAVPVPPGGVGPDGLAALDVLPVEAPEVLSAAAAGPAEAVQAAAAAAAPPAAAPAPPAAPTAAPSARGSPSPAPSRLASAGAAPAALVGALAGAAAAGGEGLTSTLRGLFGGGRRASSAGGGGGREGPSPAVAAVAGPPRPGSWGPAAAARLAALAPTPPSRVASLPGGVAALAAARGLGSDVVVYAVGPAGDLQSSSVNSGAVLRRAALFPASPLTCLALLPGGGGPGRPANLVALAGGADGRVHAYQPASGAVLGSWVAHGDAVTAAVILPGGGGGGGASSSSTPCLATASWDGTVRVWALDPSSPPWAASASSSPSPPTPLATLAVPPPVLGADPPGVWALAVADAGAGAGAASRLILAGTDDGGVFGWDARCPPGAGPAFVAPGMVPGGDYIGGLALCPASAGRGGGRGAGPLTAVAACGDGRLRLLALSPTSSSITVAATSPPAGAPLRCVACDGAAAVAGTEDGRLLVWDLGNAGGEGGRGSDGGAAAPLLPALTVAPGQAVTSVTVGAPGGGGSGGKAPPALVVLAGDDGGDVSVWRV